MEFFLERCAQASAQRAWFEGMDQAAVDAAAAGAAGLFAARAGGAPVFDVVGAPVEQVEQVERELPALAQAVAELEVAGEDRTRFFLEGLG